MIKEYELPNEVLKELEGLFQDTEFLSLTKEKVKVIDIGQRILDIGEITLSYEDNQVGNTISFRKVSDDFINKIVMKCKGIYGKIMSDNTISETDFLEWWRKSK